MAYQLRPYGLPKRERPVLVFDAEGFRDFSKERMVAYLCGVYDGADFIPLRGFDCMKEFVNRYVVKSYRGCIFYAHFGSIFDFPLLLQELQSKENVNIYPVVKGSKIIKLTVKDEFNHNWYFHDSSALLNFSLEELTRTFKVAHAKKEPIKKSSHYDKDLYELYKKDPKAVIEYLRYDCIGLYEVLDEFKKKMLDMGGDLGLTIASTALKTFQRGYQKENFYMCDKAMNDELRNAYYGGRTEIFRLYAPELRTDDYYYYYDINSLYPFVMDRYEYPISQPKVLKDPPKTLFEETEGITYAIIRSPKELYIPILPSKVKVGQDQKLMFLLGSFEGYWDNALLRKAKELGYSVEPLKSFVFECAPIFRPYIRHFYPLKEQSEHGTPMYLIAKLLMNALYGKYGQRQEGEGLIRDPFPDPERYQVIDYIDQDTGWVRVKEESHGKSFLPHISIHVTAMAQLWLYQSIEDILEKGYRVYYCDTDSLTTDYSGLRTSTKLGDWKLEHKLHNAYFILPKTYKIVTDHEWVKDKTGMTKCSLCGVEFSSVSAQTRCIVIRAKGYTKALREKISKDAFERALFKNDTSGFEVKSDFPEMLRPLASFNRRRSFNSLDYLRRSLQTRYNKRKILKDFDTRPYNISELAS